MKFFVRCLGVYGDAALVEEARLIRKLTSRVLGLLLLPDDWL